MNFTLLLLKSCQEEVSTLKHQGTFFSTPLEGYKFRLRETWKVVCNQLVAFIAKVVMKAFLAVCQC